MFLTIREGGSEPSTIYLEPITIVGKIAHVERTKTIRA
jgi:hypothetical protein